MSTKIEWTDEVWNPIVGCSKASEGCRNCYAFELHNRRHKGWGLGWDEAPAQYRKPFSEIQLFPDRLDKPLKWRDPRRIFVNSMSDLFHEDVPDDFIIRVWETMAGAPQHIFQILTKRPKRMLEWVDKYGTNIKTGDAALDNVWLGVSVENQETANERIPLLLQTPAAVRFISMEPLLGPVNIFDVDDNIGLEGSAPGFSDKPQLHWIIVGGESGKNARPMHPDWVRDIRDQATAANIPFFFKQWGEWVPANPNWYLGDDRLQIVKGNLIHKGSRGQVVMPENKFEWLKKVGKKKAGRLLDGRTWGEIPEVNNL